VVRVAVWRAVPASGAFTLQANQPAILLTSVTPDVYGANASAVLSLTGAGFLPGTVVELVRNGDAFPAEKVAVNAFDRLTATFDLSGREEGIYDVRLTHPDGETTVLGDAFTVIPAGEGVLETRLILPWVAGPSSPATIYVEYANTGNSAIIAPILTLQSGDEDGSDRPLLTLDHSRLADGFWSSGIPDGFDNSVQIYATGALPGLLLPGERITVPVYYAGLQQPFIGLDGSVEFELLAREADDVTPIDWDELTATLQPSWMNDAAWDVVVENLQSELGTTWGDYVHALGESAGYLAQLGIASTSASELYAFEFQQAIGINPIGVISSRDAASPTPEGPLEFVRTFATSVVERHRAGRLGYGWSTPWEIEAVEDGHIETIVGNGETQNDFILDAVVIRSPDGSERRFMPDRRDPDRFLSPSSESGTLRKLTIDGTAGGTRYELKEANGRIFRFHAFGDLKGKLEYSEDTSGNRTSVTYTQSAFPRPTQLVHSSGASIQIAYNGQGRIGSVTDSTGWTTTYTYDAAGLHLLTATDPSGTTTYDYFTSTDLAREHALRSLRCRRRFDGCRRVQ
jgi:YD repeat-containing protein